MITTNFSVISWITPNSGVIIGRIILNSRSISKITSNTGVSPDYTEITFNRLVYTDFTCNKLDYNEF